MTSLLPLYSFKSLDSTNAEGKRQLQLGTLTEPVIILATTQTAGRGTQGRAWHNAPHNGGLYFSLVIPNHSPTALPLSSDITQMVAVACVEHFHHTYQLPMAIKPINDLMLPLPTQPHTYGKAGGILVESMVQGSDLVGYVIGIGLNWWGAPTLAKQDANIAIACIQVKPTVANNTHTAIVAPLCQHLLTEVTQQLTTPKPHWHTSYHRHSTQTGP